MGDGQHLIVHGPLGPAVSTPNPQVPAFSNCFGFLPACPPSSIFLPTSYSSFPRRGPGYFSFPLGLPSRV